jgi:hypothetical protein
MAIFISQKRHYRRKDERNGIFLIGKPPSVIDLTVSIEDSRAWSGVRAKKPYFANFLTLMAVKAFFSSVRYSCRLLH